MLMAVMVPRETVTEHRLDALEKKVDEGFGKVDERFKQVDARFDRVDARFDRLEERFDAFNRTLWQVGGMIFAALLGIIATQL
jgi:tetrahydromethanopterin S-methyltransferase subunit G